MKREFLKSLGLEDNVIDAIMKENGNDINTAKAGAEAQAKFYQDELEKVKTSSTDWENKYNTLVNDTKDYTDLKQFKVDTLAKEEKGRKVNFLKANGCKHPELLVDTIDFSKATYDNEKGTYTGLDEVIKSKKEQYKDMFEATGTQEINPSNQPPAPSDSGLMDRYKAEHPEAARFIK